MYVSTYIELKSLNTQEIEDYRCNVYPTLLNGMVDDSQFGKYQSASNSTEFMSRLSVPSKARTISTGINCITFQKIYFGISIFNVHLKRGGHRKYNSLSEELTRNP
jgi:hypothetical protein